jgi:hypothetical protein
MQDRLQPLGACGFDAQAGGGRIGLALADGELQDLEGALEVHDLIQHFWQDERIDDVAAEADDL